LFENNAVLTKDNMIRRKWVGTPSCLFCNQNETANHLFFQCTVARCIWGVVALCLGTNTIPGGIHHYKAWIQENLPNGNDVYHFGFSAICWALWKCRNRAAFDGRRIKHRAEIFIHACAFMSYWAGLQAEEGQAQVVAGVETMLKIAYKLLADQARSVGGQSLPAPQGGQTGEMKIEVAQDRCVGPSSSSACFCP
jgi:hypothetical protein